MTEIIVVEHFDNMDNVLTIIGVASGMDNAFYLRSQYFNSDHIGFEITKTEDIRDSGLEYIEHYVDQDGDYGKVIYRRFTLNSI
jgi:hypothetical protein